MERMERAGIPKWWSEKRRANFNFKAIPLLIIFLKSQFGYYFKKSSLKSSLQRFPLVFIKKFYNFLLRLGL